MSACELCGEAAAGRYLCERHAVRLARQLDELPTLYSEVGECLVPRRAGGGDIVATKSAAGPRSPLNEDVLDTVNWGRAAEVVHLWRVDVQRERWPQHGAPAPAPFAADCRWLAMELEWIADYYPAAGEMAREVGELETMARSVVGDPAPRRQRLGTCVAVSAEGVVCGAVISRLPGQTRVQCQWCQYVYETGLDWIRLQHFQDAAS
ncbi:MULTISPECIES: hypothetical protein [unclassified Streptomyces]|uniref:hypothetical protein n=1 Tax=unclassified Streptomyces TaxID=2593676 RepID=UPI00093911B0|nr:hypothetical protein [Streptomyces sp. CB01883]OKJ73351.1 hypothetical protein AMK32_37035 [Streptomyces sp. CB01883]